LTTILAPAEGYCDNAKDIAEGERSLGEVRFIGMFCQKLVDGDITSEDTSLAETVTAINANCTTLLQFIEDEDIALPEKDDVEVRTSNIE